MNPLVHLLLISLSLHRVHATWRQDHAVRGLPTLSSPDLTSFAGVVPVRHDVERHIEVYCPLLTCGLTSKSGLFYWLFEAEEPKHENPPLLLWIQGGPGSSSGVGLFYEVETIESVELMASLDRIL